MTDTTARVAVRAYRRPYGSVTGLRGLIHVNCDHPLASTLVGTHGSAKAAEAELRDMGYPFSYCGKSTHTASQENRQPAPVVQEDAVVEPTVEDGPRVHRFDDTDTAYDITQTEERVHRGIRDGDVLVVESEGVVGVLTNAWPVALTEAHGQFHLMSERYLIREMNDGRFAASADVAERVAADLGLSLMPQHRAPASPVVEASPAVDDPAADEDVWEAGHCTPMAGGAVHEVTTGLDGSDGGPEYIFPLCRSGAMTNQGTRYRKVTAELTCRNCLSNRDRRRAAKARRLANAAVVEAPAAVEASADEDECAALLTEIGARLSAGLVWSTAAAFQPVREGDDGPVIGWTYRTRSGSEVRYAYVAARGLVLEGFHELRHRADAERELLAHREAGTDAAELMPPVATYLTAVLAGRSEEQLAKCLHTFNVDIVKTVAEGPGRLIVTRGPDFLGTIFDAGSKSRRGRYEAWAPYAGTRHNIVGFYATVEEATARIAHAWPVAAWELAEETGASVADVLAAANLLAGEEGVKVHLRIATATGADQKFFRGPAAILQTRLTRQQARAAVTREEIEALRLAKAAALLAHEGAHTFRPFCRPGEEAPAGWTFRVGFGAHARYGVTTAADGVAPIGLYEYATTAERAFHQAEEDARTDTPDAADQAAEPGEQQARERMAGAWPNASKFEAEHDEEGRLLGYTFQVGALHGARYGWITVGGTYAQTLDPYRSYAVTLLPHAVRDEQAGRR